MYKSRPAWKEIRLIWNLITGAAQRGTSSHFWVGMCFIFFGPQIHKIVTVSINISAPFYLNIQTFHIIVSGLTACVSARPPVVNTDIRVRETLQKEVA
jgi:hypothetical protein